MKVIHSNNQNSRGYIAAGYTTGFRELTGRMSAEYEDGTALKRHADSAHKGVVDPNCRGCRDIQKRAELVRSRRES